MRTMPRLLTAAGAASLLALGAAPAAQADDVHASSPSFQLLEGQQTLVLGVGDSAEVTLTYAVTGSGRNPEDGKAGCNLSGGPLTQLAMDVVATPDPMAGPAGVSGLPGSVTFDSCDDDGLPATVTLSLTAVSPGTTTYAFAENSDTVAQGTFDTSGSTFVVVVLDEDGRDAPAIANEWLHRVASPEQLASCRDANGTNDSKSNWHGQLIATVAQFFEGQSFTADEEHVVVDKVIELCGL
jgi:hypothetical protein